MIFGFPASPFASSSAVSFVDVSPSTDIILYVSCTLALSAFCKSSFEIAASVVTKLSIVHIFGWIMPEPLHIPPIVTVFPPKVSSTTTSFFTVSVVMIASAASVAAACVCASIGCIVSMPARILSIGICAPITPVEATST